MRSNHVLSKAGFWSRLTRTYNQEAGRTGKRPHLLRSKVSDQITYSLANSTFVQTPNVDIVLKFYGQKCDSPLTLFNSMLDGINTFAPNAKFLVMTGDCPDHAVWASTEQVRHLSRPPPSFY